ncbi:MAG TPA: UDP-N-acetylglucosamine--N-acetylmuramyl-(pentapeptide) pyrophosphoryl-undecaprenol N-acetylglucosamine transferase [Streptosporangiaceae bacterium]
MPVKVGITGGGSAGHVVPALAVAAELRRLGNHELVYFGRAGSIEERLALQAGLRFVALPAAGLRRYRSWRNLLLPFVVIAGIVAAALAVRRERIGVLFCKGAYVSVPVAIGAWLNRVPFAVHESDDSLGLANRMLALLAAKVLVSSATTKVHVPGRRIQPICTGLPVRDDLVTGKGERFRVRHSLARDRPVLLVFAGSSGSVRINAAVRNQVEALLANYEIVHVCGPGNLDAGLIGLHGYHQFEYLDEDMTDALDLADVVIGRAGATTLAELSALGKPAVLIPLPLSVSRGDQIVNAEIFARQHDCVIVPDDEALSDGRTLVGGCAQLARAVPRSMTAGLGSRNAAALDRDGRRAARAVAREVVTMARSRHRRAAR